jgi:Neuraminidase (sialidase)
MVTRILLLLIVASCGNNIKLKDNKLLNVSPLSPSEIKNYQKEGTFIKGTPGKITYNGTTYTVSIYSSKTFENFSNSIPANSQIPVLFTGGTSGNQIVVENIQRK